MINESTTGPGGNGPKKKKEEFLENKKKEEMEALSNSQITLNLIDDTGGGYKKYTILNNQGNTIGFVNIRLRSDPDHIEIIHIEIQPKEMNNGYGTQIYKELVRLYKVPLISYRSSTEADRVWESLKKEGLMDIDEYGGRMLKVQDTNQEIGNLSSKGAKRMTENNKKIVVHTHLKEEEIEFRKNIEKFLEYMVGKDIFNVGKIKDYHIFTEGVSSVVAKIITENGKEYIFKSCSDFVQGGDNKIHIEAKSFEIWNKYGVKTPKIYQESNVRFNNREIPYIIMGYITPTKQFKEVNEPKLAYEVGENIAKMAKSEGKGFGWIKKIENTTPIGQYDTIEEYYHAFEKKFIKELTEKNIIEEKQKEKIYKAIEILKNDFDRGTMPSLNHEDVRLDNLFLTEPITIFDPNPKLEHPLADLAATELYLLLENKISSDKKEFRKENLRKGYEEITQKKIDKNIFNACLVIRILQKMRLHHMREKKQRVQDELKILDQIQLA